MAGADAVQRPIRYREKMTLFWHGHFATSVAKVRDSYLMWQQNELLREHAFGNFGLMVKAISRDPAMLIWLDTRESKKDHPNENFAREVMELFTLGIGNYTENDVQQGARAFTGYRIDPRDETFRYAPFQHDDGVKQFLGQTRAVQRGRRASISSCGSRRARSSSRRSSGRFTRTRTRARRWWMRWRRTSGRAATRFAR